MAHRTADVEKIKATIPEGMPFRGDRGRVNVGVLPAPGSKDISFATDPFCGSSAKAAAGNESAVAIMVYADSTKPQGFSAHAVTDAHCAALKAAWKMESPTAAALVCTANLRITADAASGATRYSFPLGASVAAAHGASSQAPFVTGVVIAVPKSGDGTVSMAKSATVVSAAVSGEPCAKLVSKDGVRVCVDTLYSDYRPGGRCLTTVADVDLGLCRLTNVDPWKNDFDKNCRGPGCTKGPLATELKLVPQLACGALAMPFDFRVVKQNKTKKLRGRSAIARGAGEGEGGPIVIPGSEFLGSIRKGFDRGNPKAPDLDVTPGAFTNEVALQGSVDEDLSIVLLLPRAPVTKVCPAALGKSEEACQTYAPKSLTLVCADTANCENREAPSYFYCESTDPKYLFTGMPCTRPAHCDRGGVKGTCTGRPVCVPKGNVWTGRPLPAGADCESDANCEQTGTQCGYALFDFSTRDRIARELAAGQIGTCVDSNGNPTGERCDASMPCAAGETCEGYILFDDGEK